MESERNFGRWNGAEELHPGIEKALSFISEKTEFLSVKYGIEKKEIFREIEKRDCSIPLSALSFGTAPLEAIVSYLKDRKGISIKEISKILARSYRTVWATYSNSKKRKFKKMNKRMQKEICIPLSAFSNSNLGIFESAVKFLREERSMRYHAIAEITGRDERTVWTAYQKAKEKE
jgi:DNA-directed RNA polymerase specialized sigma24 family protein